MTQTKENIENTYFNLVTGVDTLNYFVIGDRFHVAGHESILPKHESLVEQFRSLVHDFSTRSIGLGWNDELFKKLNLEFIGLLNDFLVQINEAGLWLTMRMWSEWSSVVESQSDNENLCESLEDEVANDDGEEKPTDLCAVVEFMIVPNTLPNELPERGNGHREVYLISA